MASKIVISILVPMADDGPPPAPGERRGTFVRSIPVWINDPGMLQWNAEPRFIRNCQKATYKDGDQLGKDVPAGGSVFYDDFGNIVFKLFQFKPGTGRDPIRPSSFPRDGIWTDGQSKPTAFTFTVDVVDGKGASD